MAQNYSNNLLGSSYHGTSPAIGLFNDNFAADEGGDNFDSVMNAQNQQVGQSQANLKRTQQMQAYADQVSQQSQEDSLKIGLANLLAKAKNMQTQSHLMLAKEAIEVSKSST